MKIIAINDGQGLTADKKYEVIEESCGFYKVELDNGNIAFRESSLFKNIKISQDFNDFFTQR